MRNPSNETYREHGMKRPPLDFDDPGAEDDEPAKGVTMGDIRAWHDEIAMLRARLGRIENVYARKPDVRTMLDALATIRCHTGRTDEQRTLCHMVEHGIERLSIELDEALAHGKREWYRDGERTPDPKETKAAVWQPIEGISAFAPSKWNLEDAMGDDKAKREVLPSVIKGAGALLSALDCIGLSAEEGGDRKVARIVVDHEQDLRELVRFALDAATQEI